MGCTETLTHNRDVSAYIEKGKRETMFASKVLPSGCRLLEAADHDGNLLDDIIFTKAYPLSYDGNGNTNGNAPQNK